MKMGWQAWAAACAVGALATAPANGADDVESILVILAHPDDELVFAPALANATRNGTKVMLVYTTRGDAGPGVSDFPPGEALAAARSEEARCAARALGAGEPILLDYPDGQHGDEARGGADGRSGLEGELRQLIEDAAPDTVITWGPDGGYGHVDHRMLNAIVSEIVQEMAADKRPDLLHPAIPTGSLPPIPELQRWATTDPSLLAVRITYGDADLAQAEAAVQCHVTQFDATTRAAMAQVFHASIWREGVHFREAFGDQ